MSQRKARLPDWYGDRRFITNHSPWLIQVWATLQGQHIMVNIVNIVNMAQNMQSPGRFCYIYIYTYIQCIHVYNYIWSSMACHDMLWRAQICQWLTGSHGWAQLMFWPQSRRRQPLAATPLRSPLEGALEAFHSRWDLMSCAQPDLSDQVCYGYLIFGWNHGTDLRTQSSFLDMDVNNMVMELVLSNTARLGRTWFPSSQLCFLHLEELQLDRLPLHQLPCSAAGWACITLCFGQ